MCFVTKSLPQSSKNHYLTDTLKIFFHYSTSHTSNLRVNPSRQVWASSHRRKPLASKKRIFFGAASSKIHPCHAMVCLHLCCRLHYAPLQIPHLLEYLLNSTDSCKQFVRLLNLPCRFISLWSFSNYSPALNSRQFVTKKRPLNPNTILFCFDVVSNSCLDFPSSLVIWCNDRFAFVKLRIQICSWESFVPRPFFVDVKADGLVTRGEGELRWAWKIVSGNRFEFGFSVAPC